MKVIDLLNKIANGEDVPKKIRFNNIEWNKVYGEKNVCYINEYDSDFFLYFFRKNLDFTLNDEVEIIEENNKIEYVGRTYDLTDFHKNYPEVAEMLRDLADKTIEIMDFINEGRDE